MLGYKIFAAGLAGPLAAAMLQDVVQNATAAGTNQATAYAIVNACVMFTTVASGTGAILPSTAAPSDFVWIYNRGANALLVYPPVGAQILVGGTNIPFSIAAGTPALFMCFSATEWAA